MSEKAREVGTWIVVALLAVVTLTLYVDNLRTKKCLADYIRQDQASTAPRIQAASERNAATDRLVASIMTATTREQSRAALEDYNKTSAAAERKRIANPPPPFPNNCGV